MWIRNMHSSLFVVIMNVIFLKCNNGHTITCNTNQCASSTISCTEDEDCYVYCTSVYGCLNATINCPVGSHNCNIYCSAHGACQLSNIRGHDIDGGDLIVEGDGDWELRSSEIYCPKQGDCNVTCASSNPSYGACASIHVFGQQAKRVFVDSGQGGNSVLESSHIYCPYDSDGTQCEILIRNNYYTNQMKGMVIYAIESFNDLSVVCQSKEKDLTCYPVDDPPTMYCTQHYNQSCLMNLVSSTSDQWRCQSGSVEVCNNYSLPDIDPSIGNESLSIEFIKHDGMQCTGSLTDILRDFEGTLEECKAKCEELDGCVAFVRVNSGFYASKCYFRAGTLNDPTSYTYDDRDCFEVRKYNESSIVFGFVTSASSYAITRSTVTLTLYWEGSVYQCNVEPTEISTYYPCDTSNNETTTHCDTSAITPPIEYGLQIDNEDWDEVEIDRIIIQTMVNGQFMSYIGEYFCFNHSSTQPDWMPQVNDHCLDATYGGYDSIAVDYGDAFQSQIIVIDPNSTDHDEFYVYVNDLDDAHVSYVCTPDASCVDAIMTPAYGAWGGMTNIDLHQGRVYQISGWGIVDHANYPGIANFQWKSDEQTTFNEDYGWAGEDIVDSCATYTLTDDEYINGYTILYNDAGIWGITFQTNTQRITPHCASNNLPAGSVSEFVEYPNRYLSGFYVKSGLMIDGLAFQFTAINNTNKCDINNDTNSTTHWSANITNIIIQNYNHSEEWWVAFTLSNIDLSCGGSITKVEISDSNAYDDVWIANDPASIEYDFYSFLHTGSAFTLPLSVRITARYNHMNQTIVSDDVITEFTALRTFDFGSNFCQQHLTTTTYIDTTDSTDIKPNDVDSGKLNPETTVEISYSHIQYAVISAFVLVGILGFIDARCIRRNDFFHLLFIFLSMLNVLDMLSDVFFAVDVFGTYLLATEHKSQFLIIFIASVSFIIIPVMISLYQLHAASSKHWLKDNKIRQWLVQYVAPLYGVSILTGSSFGATFIFNSNLFDMNIFDMGLNKKYLLSWKTKRVYSILFFENIPQLCLSVWYTFMIGNITFIPAVQMLFSVISIIVSALTFCMQKKIYFTQDFVEITMDVKGQCVIDNLKVCQRRIEGLKQYLAQSVFGVHKNAIDIEKPANVSNGVQIRMHIFHVHNETEFNAVRHYQELLFAVIKDYSLQERIQKEWKLSSMPEIDEGEIETIFVRSKEKKQNGIDAKQVNNREGVLENETAEVLPFRKSDSTELQHIWTETDYVK
eukprot:214488_1